MDFVSEATQEDGYHSVVSDAIVKKYLDQFASCFIMFAFARKVKEPMDYSALFVKKLDPYIDFADTLEFFEDNEAEILFDLMFRGLCDYCVATVGKMPTKSAAYWESRWKKNIATGMRALKMKLPESVRL